MAHEVKIFPLMSGMHPENPRKATLQVCVERECARWSKGNKSCEVVFIADAISVIDCSR